MTKRTLENQAFEDRLNELDCVIETKMARKEIEAKIYCENPAWGLPNDIENLMKDDGFSNNRWVIVDFSGINELENGGCHITVYFKGM